MSPYNKDIFVYEFCWNQEPEPFDAFIGAAHSRELAFIFGNMDENGIFNRVFTSGNKKGRIELSDAMISYWKNFIRCGKPGDPDGFSCCCESLPNWDNFGTLFGKTEKIIFDASNTDADIYMD